MLLDYEYSRDKKQVSISYIKDDGNKEVLHFDNVSRFKSYYYKTDGPFTTWNDCRCDIKYTTRPSKFDLKEFIFDLSEDIQQKINKRVFPKLYTFDIETQIKSRFEFTDPRDADQPVLTISVVSPNMNAMVLGIRKLSDNQIKSVESKFHDYLDAIPFYRDMNFGFKPKFKYVYFETEESMLRWFLEHVVAKVPVLAGWNSILYDWCYITNRIKNFYPNLSVKMSSITNTLTLKNYENLKGEKVSLYQPVHTLILDMMDVIGNNDWVVMPIKESMNLDYIAHESIGANKIEYEGSLQDLYEEDYERYVYYNLIDSILVQLIDKKFKTMDSIYMESIYCTEKIGSCFSKIALTEALILKDFRKRGVKIVWDRDENIVRGKLLGAYVKQPTPGRYGMVVCNDYASLYPSTMITNNLSFDNLIGTFYDEHELVKYADINKYVIVGPIVFENIGSSASPRTGRQIGIFLDEDRLKKYREDKNYFVSVNGHVYKNDKQYTLGRIEETLYNERKISKYLAKKLDAQVISDIDHIINKKSKEMHEYDQQMIECLAGIGYDIKKGDDLKNFSTEDLNELKRLVKLEIAYHGNLEQAIKNMMNSIYGGSSNVAFYWFNLSLARDITGEARNNTMMMERHLKDFWYNNWLKDPKLLKMQKDHNWITDEYKFKALTDWNPVVYGDTDSLYIEYQTLIDCIQGSDKWSVRQRLDFVLELNLNFLDQHNNDFIREYYEARHAWNPGFNKFELETVNKAGVWLNVKKRYGQILLYKDGKYFDEDNLPIKAKGLELIKSSYPKLARKILSDMMRFLLDYDGKYLVQELNLLNVKYLQEFRKASIEDICANVKCNTYAKYVEDDSGEYLKLAPKAPANVQALARLNWLNNKYKLGTEPLYGGKIKMYCIEGSSAKNGDMYFGFESNKYPKWAEKHAPVDRVRMYEKYVLAPFNRILEDIKMPLMTSDGCIQIDLFNL